MNSRLVLGTVSGHIDIRNQIDRIRRDRKHTWILAPFGIGFFAFTTWYNFRKAVAHYDTIIDATIAEDATPDAIRLRTLQDCVPITLSLILISLSVAAIAIFAFWLIVPDRKGKLLLTLAEQFDEQNNQQRAAASDSVDSAPEP